MASSIIGGLVASGVQPAQITVGSPREAGLAKIKEVAPVNTCTDNALAVKTADVIVLAVKPQKMKAVGAALAPALLESNALIISVAAGINCQSLNAWFGEHLAIVRSMPNTPSLLQCGATGLYGTKSVSEEQKRLADTILSAVGITQWVDAEADLDAVTAVSGSGPAYFFLAIEAMQQAGEKLGLSAEVAKDLSLQTAYGAARMARESDVDVAELRRRVTSPNGTTERGIELFQQGGLEALFLTAMTGARDRSIELAKELGDA